jgi:hypothetical protein
MKRFSLIAVLFGLGVMMSRAEDQPSSAVQPAARPRQAAAPPDVQPSATTSNENVPPHQARFVSEATWGVAGYNNNEVYYAVFVTNLDGGIIRCATQITGYYIDKGTKLTIADRQLTTVFPGVPTQVGIWMDMDQASGATYSVKCHPV